MSDNFEYPIEAIEKNEKGRVYIRFVVEIDGSISNIKVKRGVSDAIDGEAVRLIQNMPKWKPAEEDGKAVRSSNVIPINFILDSEDQQKKKVEKSDVPCTSMNMENGRSMILNKPNLMQFQIWGFSDEIIGLRSSSNVKINNRVVTPLELGEIELEVYDKTNDRTLLKATFIASKDGKLDYELKTEKFISNCDYLVSHSRHFLISNKENKITLNLSNYDPKNIQVKMENGKVSFDGLNTITAIPNKEKVCEISVYLDGKKIRSNQFPVRRK